MRLFTIFEMEKIQIGKITSAVALRGEVKVYTYSDQDRYKEIKTVLVEDERHEIEKVRYQNHMVILKLSDVNDRNAAEALQNKYLYITEDQLPELPEGEYYIRDLIGMEVKDEEGTVLGIMENVLQNTAQDVYEVKRENGKTLLIPGVKEFIINVDLNERVITVRLPEGLLDL